MDQFVSKSYAYVKILVKMSKVYFEQIRPKCKCPLYKLYIILLIYIYISNLNLFQMENQHIQQQVIRLQAAKLDIRLLPTALVRSILPQSQDQQYHHNQQFKRVQI